MATGAKKVPVAGLIVGTGMAIWRFIEGDPKRGFMELASGAASTIPIYGTAASLAIDGAIAWTDGYEAMKEHEANKNEFETLTTVLQNLWTDVENLDKWAKRIKDAYDSFDFEEDGNAVLDAIDNINWD